MVLDFFKKIQNDHQVIYIKEYINEEILTLVETMILNKLKTIKKKLIEIVLFYHHVRFTNIVDNCIKFYDEYNKI